MPERTAVEAAACADVARIQPLGNAIDRDVGILIEHDAGLRQARAAQDTARDAGQQTAELGGKRGFMCIDLAHADIADEANRGIQRRNGRRRHRAALKALGQFAVHGGGQGIDAVAALDDGAHRLCIAEDDKAEPLRTVQPFVRRCAKRVDRAALHINLDNAGALRGINDEQDAVLSAKAADLPDGEDLAAEVGSMEHDQHFCLRCDLCAQFGEDPVGRLQHVEGVIGGLAARLQFPDRSVDRIVLHIADEHVRPRRVQRLDREVERIGRVQRKDDVFRLVAAEEGGERLPAFVDLFRGAQGEHVPAAPRIAAVFADAFVHFRGDTVRLRECGRGVIQINHSVYSS